MLKYNDTNIIVGVIKQILKEFNLPKIKTLNNNIIEHLKNPQLDDSMLTAEEKAVITIIRLNAINASNPSRLNKLFINADTSKIINIKNNEISDVSIYDYDNKYLNITRNLEISNNIYDSYTHKYLGEYLRFIRDYKGVNLMSMYNCFANEVCSNANISYVYTTGSGDSTTTHTVLFDSTDKKYKIYMVPVKFAQRYTIAIDCHSDIQVVAGIVSSGNVIKVFDDTLKTYSGCMFSSPVIYDKLCYLDYYNTVKTSTGFDSSDEITEIIPTNKELSEDDSIYLFVKVPFNCNSSFVVLEGEYLTDVYYEPIYKKDKDTGENIPIGGKKIHAREYKNNTVFINNLQLLEYNSLMSHPIADRLIEFLLENVIGSLDEISENIYRVQKALLKKEYPVKDNSTSTTPEGRTSNKTTNYLSYISKPGIWTDELKNTIIQYYLNTGRTFENSSFSSYDFIGFVDKDVERLLGK